MKLYFCEDLNSHFVDYVCFYKKIISMTFNMFLKKGFMNLKKKISAVIDNKNYLYNYFEQKSVCS